MILSSRNIPAILFALIVVFSFSITGCKKRSRSDMGQVLFTKTKNKVFKDVTPEGFAEVFKKVLAHDSAKLPYPTAVLSFYEQNGYDPVFVMDHLFNGDLNAAVTTYQNAYQHGIDPKVFKADEIAGLINKLSAKKGITTLDDAYNTMARLELLSANSLIIYSNDIQFGVINPKWIYARYYTETKRPDTASMSAALHTRSIRGYLDIIQPRDPQYLALQKALAEGVTIDGISKEESKRVIMVNLERLRWKNKPTENKYVIVNIPDYTLNVMDSGKSVLSMKVCVGEGRNKDFAYSLENYTDTATIDKPNPHETPQLNSMIHSVQVNPVWNIPQSIVTKEIIKAAQDDKFYLANKGIEVYKNGDKIEDTESINWDAAAKEGSDYEFKQKPGDENSLGKIKFLFKNKSSVYLHDTPVKWAFKKADRDVSHGCVRLGDPQGLALNLFGPGAKYDLIAKDMAEDKPDPTTIGLPTKTPVYITYVTCWADDAGKLQYRKDVYGLDVVLYAALVK